MQSQLAETQRQLAATKADLKQEQQKYMKSLEQGETELVKADNMVQAEKRRAEELAKQLEEFKRANQQANASSASTSDDWSENSSSGARLPDDTLAAWTCAWLSDALARLRRGIDKR